MDLSELREQIDAVDKELIALLEKRFDVAAAIADYKQAHGLPVRDAGREKAKIEAVKAQCRPDTAPFIGELYGPIIAAARAYEASRMEDSHGE